VDGKKIFSVQSSVQFCKKCGFGVDFTKLNVVSVFRSVIKFACHLSFILHITMPEMTYLHAELV